ncbi:hypothetical protein BV25DRAFT_1843550, partial [Artomyces pyxidatus]
MFHSRADRSVNKLRDQEGNRFAPLSQNADGDDTNRAVICRSDANVTTARATGRTAARLSDKLLESNDRHIRNDAEDRGTFAHRRGRGRQERQDGFSNRYDPAWSRDENRGKRCRSMADMAKYDGKQWREETSRGATSCDSDDIGSLSAVGDSDRTGPSVRRERV